MGTFTGRVALITGAARGIGFAVAQRFADDGASVVIADLDEASAKEAAARLPGEAGHSGIGVDVADGSDVETLIARAVETHGDLHIVMNNAGVTRDNLIHKMSDDDWDVVMNVHLRGAFLVSRAAQTHFVRQRYGKIINVSSISALGNRGQSNYSAAKMGIQGLTRTLALELGRFNVNVNAVAPGFVATEMTDATAQRLGVPIEEFRRTNAAANPIGRVGVPDDIAAAVSFLASDAASYITGQTLYVDGGASLG
jgi:3-oxoacyl-[acyl-carrier protein] reductase